MKLKFLDLRVIAASLFLIALAVLILWATIHYTGLWQTCQVVEGIYKCRVCVSCLGAGFRTECVGLIPQTPLSYFAFTSGVLLGLMLLAVGLGRLVKTKQIIKKAKDIYASEVGRIFALILVIVCGII